VPPLHASDKPAGLRKQDIRSYCSGRFSRVVRSHLAFQRRMQTGCCILIILLAGFAPLLHPVKAQAPLRLINTETVVDKVSFRFADRQTFPADRLRDQLATQAPGFFERVLNTLAFLPGIQGQSFTFDPVTLQRDVARLRRFYNDNGFPEPDIDYPETRLDTAKNEIHIVFSIEEGPPLTVRENQFVAAADGGPIETQLDARLRAQWTSFRGQTELQRGTRYTDFRRTQTEGEIRTWFQDQGYAFASVRSRAEVDSASHSVTPRFLIDPGPRTRVSEIAVDGNESISPSIVRRELPFQVGDRFSMTEVMEGQRALQELDLFRVALVDVPDQPHDSTVTVRYRVRESELRAYSGQVGYGTFPGVTLDGSWRHRNFFGDARTFKIGITAQTGFPANPENFFPNFLVRSASKEPDRQFRFSTTLRQPHLFSSNFTALLEPFFQERLNTNVGANPNRFLSLNEREFGLNTTLLYDIASFRSLSLSHTLTRTEQFRPADVLGQSRSNEFDESIFSLNGTFDDTDDFANPTRGYIVRPTVEVGGVPFESDTDFVRASTQLTGYVPLSNQIRLAGRLFGGRLWPLRESRQNLEIPRTASDELRRRNRIFQDRFSDFLFYAGGGSDVRGWTPQLAGAKVLQRSNVASEEFVYRAVGGRTKIGVNLEARLPFPGLGSNWGTAVFFDAAYLETGDLNLTPPPGVLVPTGPDGSVVASEADDVLAGTGLGVRYKTPFGFIRVDVAVKVNPDRLDLRQAGDVGTAVIEQNLPLEAVPTQPTRRIRLHFGIGRSF